MAIAVRQLAEQYPWWGYKRIAVIARRLDIGVTNKQAYRVMKEAGLLQKRRVRKAELYQTAKLFELLPKGPNELWQADVTYIHIPGHGWWYAVTVIDYYSRYLLTCYFTPSYRATDVAAALDAARAEAERLHEPLEKMPFLVTDNYWKLYASPAEARESLEVLRRRYNEVRPHWALIPPEGGDPVTRPTSTFMAKPCSCRSGKAGRRRRERSSQR